MEPAKEQRKAAGSKTIGFIILLVLLFVGAVVITGVARKATEKKHEPHTFRSAIPEPSQAADFTLTDHDGKPLSLSSLRGRAVLLTFGFTSCPNICPTTLGNLANIYRGLSPEEQKRVKVLFVTVDPARDTKEVLKDYVPFFNADFIGLTGTDAEIAKVTKDYGIFYQRSNSGSKDAEDYSIDHSTSTYLIAPDGKATTLYRLDGVADEKVPIGDIQRALK